MSSSIAMVGLENLNSIESTETCPSLIVAASAPTIAAEDGDRQMDLICDDQGAQHWIDTFERSEIRHHVLGDATLHAIHQHRQDKSCLTS